MDTQISGQASEVTDEVLIFLADAHAEGFLSADDALTLYRYRLRQLPAQQIPMSGEREPVAVEPSTETPAPEIVPHRASRPAPQPRAAATAAPSRVAEPAAAPQRTSPPPPKTVTVSKTTPARPGRRPPVPTPPANATPVPVVPTRPRRSRAETWARFARMRSKKLWGSFTADFAANALTYLGVLLSIVVVYVFFAFGYFGETIDEQHKHFRPLAEIGVVAFFLGLAWLLRHRSGIPQTATAVEMIGIILIPIMLSASFRDGCTPAYRPWCLPPDVDGPARWAAYAAAGLITTGIYYLYARRRSIYRYLVAPMVWISLGAIALYLEDGIPLLRRGDAWALDKFTRDGISAPQLITVLIGIGVTIALASRWRNTRLGELLAVPTVRAGVFFTPFVLIVSLVFAYNDALSRGVIAPSLADLAWPNVVATAVASAVFAGAAGATFALEGLGKRVRRDATRVLQAAAYLSLAASWLFTAGFGVSPAWLGVGLVGYAGAVAIIDHFVAGPGTVAVAIVRISLTVGAALALLGPGATIAAWGALGALAVVRAMVPAVAGVIDRFVPRPDDAGDRRLVLWAPLMVAVGAGAARLNWPDATPLVLVAAGLGFASSRLLPQRLTEIRSFASVPAIAAGLGALGVEMWRQAEGIGFEPYALSGFLLGVALLAAVVQAPTTLRWVAVFGLAGAATIIALREYFGPGAWETAWVDTAVLAVFGSALVAASRLRAGDMFFYSILGHALIAAAAVRSLWFEETAILGLSVLAAAHVAEAVDIERGRDGLFTRLGRSYPAALYVPTLVAALTLLPLTILIAQRLPFVAAERARFGPVLAALSWVYFAGALQRIERSRRIALPFVYTAALASIAVSIPSVAASLTTVTSAALLTALLAVRLQQPYASVPSWMLAVAATLLAAYRAGVAAADLYLVLHLGAVLLVVVPALLSRIRSAGGNGRDFGLGSPWQVPPLYLGVLLLPASLALAIGDGGWIAWLGASTAIAYTVAGWSIRVGGVAIPAAASLSIAYAAVVYDNGWAHPFDQPLVWMPLAASFIGLAALLPGNRRWRLLLDPAPGLVISALGVAALSVAYSVPAGVLDLALLASGVLLAAVYVIRAEEPWLIAAAISLLAAGLIAGGFWTPVATFVASLLTGFIADRKREYTMAGPLRAVTVAGLAATFALTGDWLGWSPAQFTTFAAVGAVLVIGAAVVLTVAPSLPHRLRVWTPWFHVAGHGLAVTSCLARIEDLDGAVPYGLVTVLLLLEATAIGVIGTVRRQAAVVGAAAALVAGAYITFGLRQNWSAEEVIIYTAVAGAVLSVVAAVGLVARGIPDRLALWMWPSLALGQAAGAAVVATAFNSFEASAVAGVTAAVTAFDAVLAGVVGTVRRNRDLVVGSAILAATAYWTMAQWVSWTRMEFLGVTTCVALALAIVATVLTRIQRGRLALWTIPLHALTVGAIALVVVEALGEQPGWQELWGLAGVTLAFATYAAVNARASEYLPVRFIAAGSYLAAATLAIGAEVMRDGAILLVMLVVAGIGVVGAVAAGLLAATDRPWRSELTLLALGLVAVPTLAAASVFGSISDEVGSLLIAVGAALAAYGLLARSFGMMEGAVVAWLAAAMIFVNQRIELTPHLVVVVASITLLATIELERYRRRQSGQQVPEGLRFFEWLLMLAPLMLATADMFESLWFGLALFAEGALLAAWGALSEVRRRALLGLGAMVVAIILSVVIPTLHLVDQGLTGGTWLAIGAVTAAVFIVVGSLIERQRHAIGVRLADMSKILESWE